MFTYVRACIVVCVFVRLGGWVFAYVHVCMRAQVSVCVRVGGCASGRVCVRVCAREYAVRMCRRQHAAVQQGGSAALLCCACLGCGATKPNGCLLSPPSPACCSSSAALVRLFCCPSTATLLRLLRPQMDPPLPRCTPIASHARTHRRRQAAPKHMRIAVCAPAHPRCTGPPPLRLSRRRPPRTCAQGAPEFVLRKCSHVLANNGEGSVPLTDGMRQAILSDMQVRSTHTWGAGAPGKGCCCVVWYSLGQAIISCLCTTASDPLIGFIMWLSHAPVHAHACAGL